MTLHIGNIKTHSSILHWTIQCSIMYIESAYSKYMD